MRHRTRSNPGQTPVKPGAPLPQGLYLNADVAIKILNIDYDDPESFSFETLARFKSEVTRMGWQKAGKAGT